jgi:hypothetical protein
VRIKKRCENIMADRRTGIVTGVTAPISFVNALIALMTKYTTVSGDEVLHEFFSAYSAGRMIWICGGALYSQWFEIPDRALGCPVDVNFFPRRSGQEIQSMFFGEVVEMFNSNRRPNALEMSGLSNEEDQYDAFAREARALFENPESELEAGQYFYLQKSA